MDACKTGFASAEKNAAMFHGGIQAFPDQSSVFSHFWLAIPQLVLQADWQEVWHSPQPPLAALSQRLRVFRVTICSILLSSKRYFSDSSFLYHALPRKSRFALLFLRKGRKMRKKRRTGLRKKRSRIDGFPSDGYVLIGRRGSVPISCSPSSFASSIAFSSLCASRTCSGLWASLPRITLLPSSAAMRQNSWLG